jgi:hypothetical protein
MLCKGYVPRNPPAPMATVGPATAGGAYNQQSVARYAGSAPINFRLILANILIILGCSYVILSSIAAYNIAVTDLDRIAKMSLTGGVPPCGLAVPRTKSIMVALKEVADDPFTETKEGPLVERVRAALCGTEGITDALRMALQTNEIPASCCNEYSGSAPAPPSIDINARVRGYMCACDAVGCQNDDSYGDMLRRLKHAFVLAAPAFAVYVDSPASAGQPFCTNARDPFGSDVCPLESARAKISTTLADAATTSFKILAGSDVATAPWPDEATMLYSLLAISVIEHHDRTLNDGLCFKNTDGSATPIAFCRSKLLKSISTRSIGTAMPGGCANASLQPYYNSRVRLSDSCTYTSASVVSEEDGRSNKPSELTAQPPTRLRYFSSDYSSIEPVYGVCESMHSFGLLDRKRLFGLPDPVGKFEWYSDGHGNSFTRWLSGLTYWSLYDAKTKDIVAPTDTPYLDLKLYVAYRYAATSAWAMAAIIACGYLLAYAIVPTIKLLYIRCVRRNITQSPTNTIVLKPLGTAEYVALLVALGVGLWILFVDPAAYTPYVVDSSCDDYELFGGPFGSTETRPREGLVGLTLVVMAALLLAYLTLCRRRPRKNRVMPLNPFPIWPVVTLILLALIAILVLIIRVGDEWWSANANKQSGSDSKTTTDFEEVIGAGLWGLFFLALLMGLLNQRHMAANAALEVPAGRPPIFAYIWAATGFALAVIAAIFTWPLFDCQLAWSTNELVCGDGTEVNGRWEYFWGCIVFAMCVVAILFVFWASYKVLFTVPRKRNTANAPFVANKQQEVAQLNATKPRAPQCSQSLGSSGIGLESTQVATAANDSIHDRFSFAAVAPKLGGAFATENAVSVLGSTSVVPATFVVAVSGEKEPLLNVGSRLS